MNFIESYFWVVMLATLAGYTWWQWKAVAPRMRDNPDLEPGYRRLFRGFLFWTSLPWLLMASIILSGNAAGISDFLNPAGGNDWVLAWWGLLALLLLLGAAWIFRGGAETLSAHPGLPFVPPIEARGLKWAWPFICAWNGSIFIALYFRLLDSERAEHLLTPLFPFLFLAMWIGISWLLSIMGGWRVLAGHYALSMPFSGRKLLGSGRVGFISYNNCLRAGADQTGLFLGVLFLFRAGHPPLFIPWTEMKCEERKWFLMSWVRMNFTKAPATELRLTRTLVERLIREAGTPAAFPGLPR